MARNGTDFGIRVSGLKTGGSQAPAGDGECPLLPGLYGGGRQPAISATVPLPKQPASGVCHGRSPGYRDLRGRLAKDAINTTLDMYEITFAEHKYFTIPQLDFRGTPTGIDIRDVVEKDLLPRVKYGRSSQGPWHWPGWRRDCDPADEYFRRCAGCIR